MKIIAPAKINLMLHFTGRRVDGYHVMQSAVAFADIGDELVFEPAGAFSLAIDGPFATHAPAGNDNLVTRAVRWMEQVAGRTLDMAVTLTKNIPAGAGLGGGSADAAALLRGLNHLWDRPLSDMQLQAGALTLGADVPASLKNRPQWMEGIGDILSDVAMPAMNAVLIWPGQGLATPSMYTAYREAQKPFHTPIPKPAQIEMPFLQNSDNDFTATAIQRLPVLQDILRDLAAQTGCQLARLSGSGSACFGLYTTPQDTKKAADILSAAYPAAWIRPCVLGNP